jgi:hypothetical protein
MLCRRVKLLFMACFTGAMLFSVSAQEPQKKDSSYAPVDIKEPFASIIARMKAAIMQRQMAL